MYLPSFVTTILVSNKLHHLVTQVLPFLQTRKITFIFASSPLSKDKNNFIFIFASLLGQACFLVPQDQTNFSNWYILQKVRIFGKDMYKYLFFFQTSFWSEYFKKCFERFSERLIYFFKLHFTIFTIRNSQSVKYTIMVMYAK